MGTVIPISRATGSTAPSPVNIVGLPPVGLDPPSARLVCPPSACATPPVVEESPPLRAYSIDVLPPQEATPRTPTTTRQARTKEFLTPTAISQVSVTIWRKYQELRQSN